MGTGQWVLGNGYRAMGTGQWVQGNGYRAMGTGQWVLPGYRPMNSIIWVMGNGTYGHWSFYLGAMYVPIMTITFPTQLFEAPPQPWICTPD